MKAAFHADSASIRRALYWTLATVLWACSDGGVNGVTPGVNEAIAAIAVHPGSATVALGSSLPLEAVATDANGKVVASPTIIWTVRDTAIASVSSSGVVRGRALGSTAVAASANGISGVTLITVQKPAVDRVVVTPAHVDAVPGGHAQLTAVALDAGGTPLTDRTVIWSSSNSAVASVDTTGAVTMRGVGSATITATADGTSGTSTIAVTQAPIASLSVTPNPLSMSVGQTTQLTATAIDSLRDTLSGRAIAWSSSDTTIATVTAAGMLTAVTAGSATITASSEGKSATTIVSVSNFGVGDVSIQPQSTTIVERASAQLSAVVHDVTGVLVTGRVVTWTSSNPAVARVATNGLVTGVASGEVTITATTEGKSGTAVVDVTPAPVAKVTVAPAGPSVAIGKTVGLTATVSDAVGVVLIGRNVSWTSSNASVATVSSSGVVTGVAVGTADVVATSEGISGKATVTVTAPPPAPVVTVTIAPSPATATVGATVALSATPKDSSGNALLDRTIVWSSTASSIATVSATGVVTGVAPGSATITATSEGQVGNATVNVAPAPPASVVVTPSATNVFVGKTAPLSAVVKDANGNSLTTAIVWTSSSPTVASVSQTGVVTGVGTGTATISATSGSATGTSIITVLPAPVASITLTPASPSVTVGNTVTLVAAVQDADGNVLTGRTVAWTSSAPAVATVSASGVVTGASRGTSTITATSEGQTATATVTVTPAPPASVTVTPSSANVIVGGTTSFAAVVNDASGNVITSASVTWTSSATATATVSSSGVVTGIAPGTATITATSDGKNGTATVSVSAPTVSGAVASVTVTPAIATVAVHKTLTLTATVQDGGGKTVTGKAIHWTTSSGSIATVGLDGTVHAKKVGLVTIAATVDGKSGSSLVTVLP